MLKNKKNQNKREIRQCFKIKTSSNISNRPRRLDALLDLGNGLPGVEPLGAHFGAVHDRPAPVELERVIERGEALGGVAVAGVDDPP